MTTFHKTTSFFLLFLAVLFFFTETAHGQNDPELIAKDFVKNEKYAEALPVFKDLVHLYPEDKQLNYYFGMCMAETGQFEPVTKEALIISLSKETPAKSLFYLGQCFHAEGNFAEALSYYSQFDDKAKNKVKRSTNLNELMELCKKQINPFTETTEEIAEPTPELQDSTLQTAAIQEPELIPEQKSIKIETPEELADSIINFQVNSTIKYLKIDQFRNPESIRAFITAHQSEQELNKILQKTNQLRKEYDISLAGENEEIANKILNLEKETYSLNQAINEQYIEARKREMTYWDNADSDEIETFGKMIKTMEDSIWQAREDMRIKKVEAQKPILVPESFIKKAASEEAVKEDNGIIYKIQIGAYSKTPPDWVQRLFKKLSVIRRIDQYTDDNGVTVYTVGELKSFDDALQMQSQIRTEGVSDAFIAAYKGGERITVKEARSMTQE